MHRLALNEVQSRIYLYCDENRSFSAIRKKLLAEFQSPITEEQTQRLLDQFVERGLMFREGNRYLSLAVRKSSARNHAEKGDSESTRAAEMPMLAQDVSRKNPALPILSVGAKTQQH